MRTITWVLFWVAVAATGIAMAKGPTATGKAAIVVAVASVVIGAVVNMARSPR